MERDLSDDLSGNRANYEEHVQLAKVANGRSSWCRRVRKRGTGTLYKSLAMVVTCHKAQHPLEQLFPAQP